MRWEYCELEVVYRLPAVTADLYLLKPDGEHERSTGRYGEMMAKLGEEGWELVAATDVRTRDDPLLKMFFKRPMP